MMAYDRRPDPSPEEIRRLCAGIQSDWTEEERLTRAYHDGPLGQEEKLDVQAVESEDRRSEPDCPDARDRSTVEGKRK